MGDSHRPQVTASDRQRMVENLGFSDSVADKSMTFTEIQRAIDADADAKFGSIGETVREDLTGQLDAARIETALSDLERQIERLPDVRNAGIPDGDQKPEALYRELITPGWDIYNHLADVGAFESLETHLPAFTPEHIEGTAHEILQADELTDALTELGYDDHEKTVLLRDVVNNKTRLSRWVPTRDIPESVEFTVDYVPPLHQRAMGGGLLWIKALDRHLWQKEILVTEEILDDVYWRTNAMLAGLYIMGRAVHEIALDDNDDGDLTDAQVVAALIAGAAIVIVNQEELMRDAFWLTEEKRAPTNAR